MIKINKEEFLKEFENGDILGLDNLEKQINNILIEIRKQEKENSKNIKISYKKVLENAEKLNKKEKKINKIKVLLKYVKNINYIYITAETNENFSSYYILSQNLYFKVLNDLFDLLNIKKIGGAKKWKWLKY